MKPKTIEDIVITPYKAGYMQDVCCPRPERKILIFKKDIRQLLIDRCKELRKISDDGYTSDYDMGIIIDELMRIGNITEEDLK
jgi:hypothetical protein